VDAVSVLYFAARRRSGAARPRRRRVGALAALSVTCAMAALAAPAAAALSPTARSANRLGVTTDSAQQPGVKSAFGFGQRNHGTLFGHLPPTQQNVELVSKLNLIHPQTGAPVIPEQIADVSVHKGHAYLNSWDSATCQGGGTFVVDIRDPANPKQVSFIAADHPFYHGEGAHVISVNTPQFQGDLLAVNNETYGSNIIPRPACTTGFDFSRGGFDLYDVTDPANPKTLVRGAGDRSPESSEVQNPARVPNSFHSVFAWQDGPRAYLVASDNTEFADVDIFDITDPTDPDFIKDFDVLELPQANQIVGQGAEGNAILHHDVVVKPINGHMRMLVSYWDAGYVQLNVDDPANPTYITDTDFDEPDPLTGLDPPQGNAHQAEYSQDSQFILASDEEFAPYRLVSAITQAPFEDFSFASALSIAEPIDPGTTIEGDTVYVGDACGPVMAPPAGVTVALAERGTCDFQTKADAIEAAGYDLGVVFNSTFGTPDRCETLINMAITDDVAIPMAFVGRANGLRILGVYDEDTYQCTGAAAPTVGDTAVPAVGTGGLTIELGSVFDGWGYAHLYDANTSEEIDAYAIQEALDPRYATGFGDLSIHEFATDPGTNLAYASYYSGGLRVMRFSRAGGLEEVGKFIDTNGSNFWGVEAFTDSSGNRLLAMSDRDYGLYILKYTGPGAVLARPPAAAAATAPPPPTPPPAVQASSSRAPSSYFTFGSLKRLMISRGRASVTINVPGPGKATATLKGAVGRTAMTLAKSKKTARAKGRLRLTFRLSAAATRSLRRTLSRRPTRRTSGVLEVRFTPDGGSRRTRNKSLSIGMR
jgi:hypothetical protein